MKVSKPADSVHLNWALPSVGDSKYIELYNEVTVLNTEIDTYFSVIQFWPAGYCGIQERGSIDDKIAIYSIWGSDNDLELVSQGPDVTVSTFGGEGTGLKSTKPLDWKVGEKVAFRVTAVFIEPQWMISCYTIFRGEESLMATFKETGPNPVQSFSSFVEDYNRGSEATGMDSNRSSTFSGTRCSISGVSSHISDATFTKSEGGSDNPGSHLCYGQVMSNGLRLSTGGVLPTDMDSGTHLTGPKKSCDKDKTNMTK